MRLVQVISDLIRRSILTTKGDLAVRGDSQPERLAGGLLKTFLAGQGASQIPAYEGHKMSDHDMDAAAFFRDTAGDEVISGMLFRPSLLFFFARCDVSTNRNWSAGIDNGEAKIALINYEAGSKIFTSSIHSIHINKSVGNKIYGYITAFHNDGFTVTFTEDGSSCANVVWLAIE